MKLFSYISLGGYYVIFNHKKSMVYLLFAGLVLAVQPMNAMQGKAAQESSGYSWLKIGLGVAVGAVAACGLYAWHSNASKKNDKKDREQKKLRDSQLSLAEKNKELKRALAFSHCPDQEKGDVAYWLEAGADTNSLSVHDVFSANELSDKVLIYKRGLNAAVYCEIAKKLFESGLRSHSDLTELTQLLTYDPCANKNNATQEAIEKIKRCYDFFKYDCINLLLIGNRNLSIGQLAWCWDAQQKCFAIIKKIYEELLRDVTSRNARRDKVEQELSSYLGNDNAWIVNQYLSVENPGVDLG